MISDCQYWIGNTLVSGYKFAEYGDSISKSTLSILAVGVSRTCCI
jgi:hypothetical protein